MAQPSKSVFCIFLINIRCYDNVLLNLEVVVGYVWVSKQSSTNIMRKFAGKNDVDDLCIFKNEVCMIDENTVKLWSKQRKRVKLSVTNLYYHMIF
jgi:hypothetical protein